MESGNIKRIIKKKVQQEFVVIFAPCSKEQAKEITDWAAYSQAPKPIRTPVKVGFPADKKEIISKKKSVSAKKKLKKTGSPAATKKQEK